MKAILIGKGRWGKILQPYIEKHFDLISIYGREYEIPDNTDAVFVATPIGTHYETVRKCLESGKHVFCEKPLTINSEKAEELKQIAQQNNVKLYTDWTEITAPSRILMKDTVPFLGQIKNIKAKTLKQSNSNEYSTLWNLHCHHLSMLSLFCDISKLKYSLENDTIKISGQFSGEIECSMTVEKNEKFFEITGDRGKIIYNYFGEDNLIFKFLNKEKKITFDEKNNLNYSVKYFKDIIVFDLISNTDLSIKITKIIENLLNME